MSNDIRFIPVEQHSANSTMAPMNASKIIVAYSHEEVALSFAAATEPDTTSSETPEILRPIQPKHTEDICKNKEHVN